MNFKKNDELRVYERSVHNGFRLLSIVPDKDAWERLGKLKAQGMELVLVRGTIEDSTYTEVEE